MRTRREGFLVKQHLYALVAATLFAWQAHAIPVTLHYKAPDARRVNLAGTFNGWKSDALTMIKVADGTWTATLNPAPGAYLYKFVVDGVWTADPNAGPPVPPDGNSALWVTPDGTTPDHKRGDGKIVAFAVKHQGTDLLKTDRTHARFIVHTAADDVSSISMAAWPTPQPGTTTFPYCVETPLIRASSDGVTDNWSVTIPVAGQTDYAFYLRDGETHWILGPPGLQPGAKPYKPYSVDMDSLSLFETPGWVKDTVWYQVFPERFFNGDRSNDRKPPKGVPDWNTPLTAVGGNPNDRYWGGDLKGVIAKLPYLKSLGITGIYMTPVFEGPDTHKYATTDYLKVDPDFGTEKILKSLCDAAHKLGMRVMLDGVFNHTGVYNPMFQDILKNQEKSRFAKWYRIKSFPVLDPVTHYNGADEKNIPYEGYWGIKWMPRLNPDNPDCAKYLINVATRWIERCGIDGWRLDVANDVPEGFWKHFRPAVKSAKKDALIVGEIWTDAKPWLQGDQFDSVMNYPFRAITLDFFARGTSDAARFAAGLNALATDYPPQATAAMYNMLGSHDVPRLLNECGGDARKMALATVFQMTWPGAPSVYYGDENGMAGGGDPWNRAPMQWDKSKWNESLRDTFKRAITLRHAQPALRSVDIQTLSAAEGGRVAVFGRGAPLARGFMVTAFNASGTEQTVAIPVLNMTGATRWADVWNGGELSVAAEQLKITLPPYGAAVLTPVWPATKV
jgi:cyclomaltodextrinase